MLRDRNHLFNVGIAFIAELDAGQVSKNMRQQFQKSGKILTSQAQVRVDQAGNQWAIVDAGSTYHIRRENEMLRVSAFNFDWQSAMNPGRMGLKDSSTLTLTQTVRSHKLIDALLRALSSHDDPNWVKVESSLRMTGTNTGIRCSPSGHIVIVRIHEASSDYDTPPGVYALVYGPADYAQGDRGDSHARKPIDFKLRHRIRLADKNEEWEAQVTANGDRVLALNLKLQHVRLYDLEGNTLVEADSVPNLATWLWHTPPDVCEEVANALGIIGDPSALPFIIRRLGQKVPAGLSNALGVALRSFPLCDTEPVILECLSRPAVEYRLGALQALKILPAFNASAALLANLDDEDERVRLAVQETAIACLRHSRLLSDDSATVLTSSIDLTGFVNSVLGDGRIADFDQIPSDPAGPVVLLLVALTTACMSDQQALPQVMNALENLTSARAHRSSQAAASMALVVALVAADVFRQNARYAEAVRLYRRAAELARQIDAPQIEWRVWGAIGENYDAIDDASAASAAFDAYRKAMSVIDALWFALLEEDKLRGFFQDKAHLYERAALNCLRLGYHALALECNEKAKTRYLGDLIARRQKDPNTALARELQDFWRKTDHLRPIRVPVAEGGGVTVQRVEIVAVEPAGATAGDVPSMAPERWEALRRRYSEYPALRSRPGFQSMIHEAWNVSARAAQVDDDDIRNGLEAFYQTLVPVYDAVRNELLPVEEPVRSQYAEDYDRAAIELEALNDRYEQGIPFFAFREFEPGWIRALCASGQPGFRGDVLAALMEALNAYLHHEPVIAVPVELDESQLPAVSFVTRSIRPESESFSQRTAVILSDLERFQTGRWRYVMQLARGEICAYRDIVAALKGKPDTALVQFMVTEQGTFVFVVIGQDAGQEGVKGVDVIGGENLVVLSLKWPTSSDLENLMAIGETAWMGRYKRRKDSTAAREAWLATMDSTIQELSEKLAMPLVQHLKRYQIQRVWLVPHRALHLVPFAALYTDAQRSRRLIDDFDICYAPSSTLQKICRERSHGRKWQRNLAIIANPTGDLPFAEKEYQLVVQLLSETNVTAKVGLATRDAILGTITESMFHFAGHGLYEWDEPLSSSLMFADEQSLRLSDLFSEQVLLPETSLVALSACETNITDPRDSSDEYLGIASGFLFAGTPAVLSTLWAVDDLSTAMLIAKFYELLLRRNHPSSALKQAQQWLRDEVDCSVTIQLLNTVLPDLDKRIMQTMSFEEKEPLYKAQKRLINLRGNLEQNRSPQMRPFARPYYWAGITITGVDSDHVLH